ncbi:MAG: flavodoxin family protein [Clostridia bacterium]|nr:flavodoxin family protein [Clostridia bacterium]
MSKRIIALAGSPKRRGNTGLLLESAVKGARDGGAEVEIIYPNSLRIKPCQGCNTCYKVDACIYQDDMIELYHKFKSAGAFIISSPVYFGSVTAQLKTIIDRCQALWMEKQTAKYRSGQERPGLFIATSGHPNTKGTRFDSSLEVVRTFGYAADMRITDTVLVADTDRIPVTEDSPVIQEAYEAGRRLTERMLNT